VVQNGCSIAKSAHKLCLEPTTISKQIKALERDLGVVLFDRSQPHKLVLTNRGELFYKMAVEQLQGIDNLFNNFNNYLEETNNSCLNLAVYYAAASHIFPKIIGKLLQQSRFKGLKIKIFNITKEDAFKKLIDKEIDLGFYPFDEHDPIPPEISCEKNIESRNAIIFNTNSPLVKKDIISKEDLENVSFLFRDTKSSYSYEIENIINLRKSNITFENALADTTIELVRYTDNITAVPEIIMDTEKMKLDSNIVVRNIDHIIPIRYFYALTLKNFMVKDSVRWLLNELRRMAKEDAKESLKRERWF